MVISTKGRYALRLMIDLAQHCDEGFISLKTVSQRQDVSLKYMEAIAAALNRANLVISQRGKEGGYRLSGRRATSRSRRCCTAPRAAWPPCHVWTPGRTAVSARPSA